MVVSGGLCFRNAFPTREVIVKRDQIEQLFTPCSCPGEGIHLFSVGVCVCVCLCVLHCLVRMTGFNLF